MKLDHWFTRLALLMLSGCTLLVAAIAASDTAGSESDPLVTLSYLNDTFMNELLKKVDEKLEASAQKAAQPTEPSEGSGQSQDFTVVTLSQGQTLSGAIGCEVMLRVGTASCVASSTPGLIDETDASVLAGGAALTANHLYMMTVDQRGILATADTVKLLVRGSWTIQ